MQEEKGAVFALPSVLISVFKNMGPRKSVSSLLLLLGTIGLVRTIVRKYLTAVRLKGNTPGPTIYPIILNDYFFVGKTLRQAWGEIFEKYGETAFVATNIFELVITTNPDNIQHIISDNKNFHMYKRQPLEPNRFYDLGRKLFGNGIFVADDEVWSIQRTHANPLFKLSSIKEMIPTFDQKSELVIDYINRHRRGFIDVQNLFMKYTLDSFGEIGFGISFGLFTEKEEVAFPSWFDKAQRMIYELGLNPVRHLFYHREYVNVINKLDDVVYRLIEEKIVANARDPGSGGTDLLSKFLALRDEEGRPFQKQWIRDIVMNFLIAGRDTTATLLTWTIYWLARTPRVYETAVKELEKIDGLPITHESLKKVPYIDYVMKESMRITAPVPGVSRTSYQDNVLPNGTLITKGQRVKYFGYFLHRSEKHWDKPLEFIPERWIDQKSLIKHSYQYLPFHGGPMGCIGRKMAETEAKVILVKLLRNFSFFHKPDHKYEPYLGLITNCEGGCPISFLPID